MHYKLAALYTQYDLFRLGPYADRFIRSNFSHELGKLLSEKIWFSVPLIPLEEVTGLGPVDPEETSPNIKVQTDFIFMPLAKWDSIRRELLNAGEFGGPAVEERIINAIIRIESEESLL